MSWWGSLEPGDWVRAARTVPASFTDQLLGTGIPRGTKGVVVERFGSRVQVEFESGWGTRRVTVRASDCRVLRRNGGVGAFRRRADYLGWARLGVALVLLWPFLAFAISYLWRTHSFHGIVGALAVGFVDSYVDFFVSGLSHPIPTIIYAVVLTMLGRFAFRR